MITLEPMSQAHFRRYLDHLVPEYAQAHVASGDGEPATALERARGDIVSLLPEGLATEDHHLLSVFADGIAEPIGAVWFELRERDGRKSAFIYDFRIDAAHRGKGFGARTLARIDETLKSMGAHHVGLSVLGDNVRARSLYEKHGFRVSGILMEKAFGARREA
jgi:ribosomal protein S18 acetylase RimI-like enzyme